MLLGRVGSGTLNSVTGERIALCEGILALSHRLLKGVKEGSS
jgi:hypothetical protein